MTVPKMLGFREECEMLAALETFDPEAFRGDDRVPQAVCSFVLALALIHNDCKDAICAHVALAASQPDGPPKKTKVWGQSLVHAFRGVGLVHELFELIRANGDVLRHDFFVSLVQHLREEEGTMVEERTTRQPKTASRLAAASPTTTASGTDASR